MEESLTTLREHLGAALALTHDVRQQLAAYSALRDACGALVDELDAYLDDASLYPDRVLLLIHERITPLVRQKRECEKACKSEGPPGPIWCKACGHDPVCCTCKE